LEPDCRQLALGGDGAGLAKLAETILNRLRILGHPLEAAFVNKALGAVRTVEQPPLERSRAKVGDQDLHGVMEFWSVGVLSEELIAPLLQYSVTPPRLIAATCRAPRGRRADAG